MASIEAAKRIESYFTNVQELRSGFEKAVAAPTPIHRLLMIHGMAGVGKRSLLLMFACHCDRRGIPCAMVSIGPHTNSSVDILSTWSKELSLQHYRLSRFNKALRQTQSGSSTTSERIRTLAGIIGKFASKTAENLAGPILAAAAGPAVVAVGSAAVGTFVEETMAFATAPLEKSEKELMRNPEGSLTGLFLADIEKIAKRRRVVLMLDSYEQFKGQDLWFSNFAANLSSNVLLVLASQNLVDWQKDCWKELRPEARIEKLDLMEPKYMEELIRRYFAARGKNPPEPEQLMAISTFAGGLPIAVVIALEVLKSKSAQEFKDIKPRALRETVEYLLLSIPEEMAPILQAAAILRWFDENTLRTFFIRGLTSRQFRTLSNYDFVYYTSGDSEILMVGDTIRRFICEYLKSNFPPVFTSLTEKAITCYQTRLDQIEYDSSKQKQFERYALELLYHLIQIDREKEAIDKSREFIDRALGTYGRLFGESIIRLLDQHLKDPGLRRWITYFRWFITKLSADVGYQASTARDLLQLLSETDLDTRLRAAIVTMLADHPAGTDLSVDQCIALIEDLIASYTLTDTENARAYLYLGGAHRGNADWLTSINDFTIAYGSCNRADDVFGTIRCLDSLAYTHLLMGDWNQALDYARQGVTVSREVGGYWLTTALKTLGWVYTYKGDLAQASVYINEALALVKKRNDETEIIKISRRLADIYDRQSRWGESNELYREFIEKDRGFGRVASMSTYLALLGISYLKQGRYEEAKERLTESLVHVDKHNEQLAHIGLGQVYLIQAQLGNAKQHFEKAVIISQNRPYYIAQATFGLAQTEYKLGNRERTLEHIKTVQGLAANYTYYDLLARLKMFQANIVLESDQAEQSDNAGFVFNTFQSALLNALRYNSFLLDEVLAVGIRGTQLRSIIDLCESQGESGRRMLGKLREWWHSEFIEISNQQQDSLQPERLSLQQIEQSMHERDFGKNKRHVGVMDQIDRHLATQTA